jgi:hypothetical protein
VTTAAATAVAFAVAAALSFFVPRRLRSLLVVGVLVVPIALATPRFVRTERSEAAASGRVPAYSNPPPFRWRKTNPALIAGIIEHVPAHESVSLVNANPQTGWIRWLAYSIAPRQLTRGRVPWTIVYGETPAQAGVHFTTQEWKYGDDWLVEQYFPAPEKG